MIGFTLNNLRVIEMLYEEDESEYVSSSLVCNIYPLIMVQRKVKQLFQVIHNKTQNNESNKCFYVDIDFKSESFPFKAIRCLTSFINRYFSRTLWNQQKHFDGFINLKKNESLSLQDHHRFNHIFKFFDPSHG